MYESVRDHRFTAVHSAHDLGKSFTAGNLAAWWIDSHPIGTAKVVSTAPTGDQVKGILWQEIQVAHRMSEAPGRVTQTEWWIDAFRAGFGRKPADYNPAAFQGHHEKYVLVVIDEACGVPRAIFDAASALVTNEHCRVMAVGNPDDATSYFAEICQPGSGWNVIHLDGLDSPAFTEEGERTPQEVLDRLVSRLWVEERKRMWGESSPIYVSKVRGLFPKDAPDAVVRSSALAKCRIAREYRPNDPLLEPIELGVDVGGGGDKSVGYLRRGARAELVFEDNHKDGEIVVGLCMQAIREHGVRKVKLDVTGFGHFAEGHLRQMVREAGIDCQVIGVNFGAGADDRERFITVRQEMWWEVGRMRCEEQSWDLSLVDDQACADLLAPKWKPDGRGHTVIESKDDVKKRLGRSPDHGDALILAYYDGPYDLEQYLEDQARGQVTRKQLEERFKDERHARELVVLPDEAPPGDAGQAFWDSIPKG